jgi:hypothetical protein
MSNKLTPEELEQVKNIRKQYAEIAYSLGENQLQKRNLLNQYDNLTLQEQALAADLNTKYGTGSINVETGEIS